jgi:hypothetical protein
MTRWSSRSNVPTPDQRERRRLRRQSRRAQGITTSGRPGLLDHATNPWAVKAARDGERRHDQEGPR